MIHKFTSLITLVRHYQEFDSGDSRQILHLITYQALTLFNYQIFKEQPRYTLLNLNFQTILYHLQSQMPVKAFRSQAISDKRESTYLLQPAGTRNHMWWSQARLERRPPACKAGALPSELWPQSLPVQISFKMRRKHKSELHILSPRHKYIL